MIQLLSQIGLRFRVLFTRLLHRLGLTEQSFLLVPAVLIGVLAACAAVAFHELIDMIRQRLYAEVDPGFLYGSGLWLLFLWPAAGGLIVGSLSRLFGAGGHGVPEVIESVVRRQGFMRPVSALQKILTSSVTIGSGGSAGAEGPIVQIGAAIASGVGYLFRIARHHMPILIGCGTAAGISAVFNSPIGGVLFTLEVILQEFSIRTFTPLVIASVIANVTTRAIFQGLFHLDYQAIFAMPAQNTLAGFGGGSILHWAQMPGFLLLGILCGTVAAGLTVLMVRGEKWVSSWRAAKVWRPAIGGLTVGVLGVLFVLIIGRWMLGVSKPFAFKGYAMPAFFGDGYGVIQQLLTPDFYTTHPTGHLLILLGVLLVLKLLATVATLATGGSGGVIAPSLFLGATTGALLGMGLSQVHYSGEIYPAVYALIGMGAALGAVVHAPLAAILILLELTSDYHIMLPAMLATIAATGMARFIFTDSVYTVALRQHGIRPGAAAEQGLLQRTTVEQVGLEPALIIVAEMPFTRLLELMGEQIRDAVVTDKQGRYRGMVRRQDIEATLLHPDSIPLLLVAEVANREIPVIQVHNDLAYTLEAFSQADAESLPVSMTHQPDKIVGVITRQSLMRHYQKQLAQRT